MAGILSLDELQRIGNGVKNSYTFDLSSINIDYWKPMQETLVILGKNQIEGLGFNFKTYVDSLAAAKKFNRSARAGKERPHPPIELESSIQRHTKDIVPELIGLLSRIIPRTSSLRTLKFLMMPIGFNEIDILSQSIQQCECLRTLQFDDIPLLDNGFARLCQSLRRKAVRELQCRNCGLTDKSTRPLQELINVHTQIQLAAQEKARKSINPIIGIVCLNVIDLSKNNITSYLVNSVQEQLDDSPILTLDLSGNKEINPDDILSSKILFGEVQNDTEQPSVALAAREAQLEEENVRLRRTVASLVQGQSVAALRSDLYAVGERADELARHIELLDELCASIDEGNAEIPKLRKRSSKKKSSRK